MILIFGLGNPGKEYEKTYHNLGFLCLDYIAKTLGAKLNKSGLKSVYGQTKFEGETIYLVKPQTYMNNSGEAVTLFKQKFKDAKILVLVDDIDLKPGEVRFRKNGSAGTHNGLRSIVSYIGQDFARVKMGTGRDEGDLAEFVLSKMPEELQNNLVEKAANLALEQIKNKNL